MLSHYPEVDENFINVDVEIEVEWLKKVIQTIRTIRSESTISPAQTIPLIVKGASDSVITQVKKYSAPLKSMCKISEIHFLNSEKAAPVAASALVGNLELLIPLQGLIDVRNELLRLEKELNKIDNDIEFAENKLKNPTFTDKAPKEIIASIEEKLVLAQNSKRKLLDNLFKIKSLDSD